MNKFLSWCLVVGLAWGVSSSVMAAGEVDGTEIEVRAAVGEFENDDDTEYYRAVIRQDLFSVGDDVGIYAAVRGEKFRHPVKDFDGEHGFVGGGVTWNGWRGEFVGNEKRYYASLFYYAPTEKWELAGGVNHSNRYEHGLKQTGLEVNVGYPITQYATVGAWYDIKNTTMRSVDDLYGGYLRFSF